MCDLSLGLDLVFPGFLTFLENELLLDVAAFVLRVQPTLISPLDTLMTI